MRDMRAKAKALGPNLSILVSEDIAHIPCTYLRKFVGAPAAQAHRIQPRGATAD